MLNLLSAIDWSEVSTEIVTTVIGAIFTVILIPLIVNFFKKRSEKRKAAKEKEKAEQKALEAKEEDERLKYEKNKEVAENFLKQQFNHINTISDGFSIKTTTLDKTWDFGISRQLTSEEKEENDKAIEQNKQAPNPINYTIDGFVTELIKEKRALIVGDAGQGKSVFMKSICNKLSQKTTDKPFFPIYVEIKNVVSHLSEDADWKTKGNIIEAVFNTINVNIESFDYISKNYEICYIFDAIDEVSPNDFKAFKTLVADSLSNSYLFFSSRPGQADICNNLLKPRKWILDEITDDKLKDFIQNDELYNDILDAESKDPYYKKLSRNPLLLCLIKNVYENNGKNLPQSRVVLFDLVIKELIQRDMAKENGNTYNNSDVSAIKEVLGQVSYKLYQKKDGESVDWLSVDSLLKEIINIHQEKDTLKHFFNEHTLVDENGFSHELFASYYCAYYLYKCICDNNRINEIVKEINKQADYWKEVVKTLLCLFEQNAQRRFDDSTEQRASVEERLKMLLTMLKTMQGLDDNYLMVDDPLVNDPDYDILCDAVSQFIDTENNKPQAEEVLIRGMLIRGENGVTSYDYDTHEIKDKRGTNPYEELFYYTVLYDFKGGLKRIYDEQCKLTENEEKALSSIQCYLFNELCEVEHCEDFTLSFVQLDYSLSNTLNKVASVNINRERGHFILELNEWPNNCCKCTSIKISFTYKNFNAINSNPHPSLSRIIIDNNKNYLAKTDCLIDRRSGELILGCKNSKIPDSVTSIGLNAFRNCEIRNIAIPSSVVEIKQGAFAHSKLSDITIPNSVTRINDWAFSSCANLTKIQFSKISKLTSIGDWAFSDCTRLQRIDIPNNVESIGSYAFDSCYSLSNVIISEKSKLTNIDIGAFSKCRNLVNITIPNTVISMGSGVFFKCINLKNITFDKDCKLKWVPDRAFYSCKKLTNIILSDNINKICESAFFDCSGVLSVKIPNKVTIIDNLAFCGCISLKNITIPDTVTHIGNTTFSSCPELETIEVDLQNTKYHSQNNCLIETESKTLILGCKNSIIPMNNSITSIASFAFCGSTGLKNVTLEKKITRIGQHAFSNCISLTFVNFEDTHGWHVTKDDNDFINKQNGIPIDVSDPEKNATYFKSTYKDYYCYKVE